MPFNGILYSDRVYLESLKKVPENSRFLGIDVIKEILRNWNLGNSEELSFKMVATCYPAFRNAAL